MCAFVFVCLFFFFCSSVVQSVCKIKTAEGVCVSVHWMNYPLSALRAWQTSNSNPCWILVSQSLPLRTLPWQRRDSLCNCVVCNGFFTEMTEWPLEQINTSLLAVSMIEMALYSNHIMFVRVRKCLCVYVDVCALKYAASCYILQVVQYCFIFFVLHSL